MKRKALIDQYKDLLFSEENQKAFFNEHMMDTRSNKKEKADFIKIKKEVIQILEQNGITFDEVVSSSLGLFLENISR